MPHFSRLLREVGLFVRREHEGVWRGPARSGAEERPPNARTIIAPGLSPESPPMTLLLTEIETRVLGSLIEKDITTPDYYPLSLNALVNACNQKNNRDPVMTLDEETVRQSLSSLQEKRLAGPASGADSRVTKYEHRLQEVFNFDRREIAALCP